MTREDLIKQAQRIHDRSNNDIISAFIEAKEFLKSFAGTNNAFLDSLNQINLAGAMPNYVVIRTQAALQSFIQYVENNLLGASSFEREIKIETVSEYLDQAEQLLNDKNIHPAAPAVIIGASLEEFLRTWLQEIGFDLKSINMNLDTYAKELRSLNLITKQDLKDIISWGGIRNDAAHGHWTNVEDRSRIKIMLEGVNLFLRKYSK